MNFAASCLNPIPRQIQAAPHPKIPATSSVSNSKMQLLILVFHFIFLQLVLFLVFIFKIFVLFCEPHASNASRFMPPLTKEKCISCLLHLFNITKIYRILSPHTCKVPHFIYMSYTQNHLPFYFDIFYNYSRRTEDGKKANAQCSNRFITPISYFF